MSESDETLTALSSVSSDDWKGGVAFNEVKIVRDFFCDQRKPKRVKATIENSLAALSFVFQPLIELSLTI